jgi:hypothetical protein
MLNLWTRVCRESFEPPPGEVLYLRAEFADGDCVERTIFRPQRSSGAAILRRSSGAGRLQDVLHEVLGKQLADQHLTALIGMNAVQDRPCHRCYPALAQMNARTGRGMQLRSAQRGRCPQTRDQCWRKIPLPA